MLNFFKRKQEKNLGELGEDAAVKYLKKEGYKILERNFVNLIGRRLGEIDIIAQKEREIVFVEVKTRLAEEREGILPEENINLRKLHKLNKIADNYIKSKQLFNFPYRFDAISVWIGEEQRDVKIKHIESIFI